MEAGGRSGLAGAGKEIDITERGLQLDEMGVMAIETKIVRDTEKEAARSTGRAETRLVMATGTTGLVTMTDVLLTKAGGVILTGGTDGTRGVMRKERVSIRTSSKAPGDPGQDHESSEILEVDRSQRTGRGIRRRRRGER